MRLLQSTHEVVKNYTGRPARVVLLMSLRCLAPACCWYFRVDFSPEDSLGEVHCPHCGHDRVEISEPPDGTHCQIYQITYTALGNLRLRLTTAEDCYIE